MPDGGTFIPQDVRWHHADLDDAEAKALLDLAEHLELHMKPSAFHIAYMRVDHPIRRLAILRNPFAEFVGCAAGYAEHAGIDLPWGELPNGGEDVFCPSSYERRGGRVTPVRVADNIRHYVEYGAIKEFA